MSHGAPCRQHARARTAYLRFPGAETAYVRRRIVPFIHEVRQVSGGSDIDSGTLAHETFSGISAPSRVARTKADRHWALVERSFENGKFDKQRAMAGSRGFIPDRRTERFGGVMSRAASNPIAVEPFGEDDAFLLNV